MAARVNKIRHDDETRLKIQTTQLIRRLHAHAMGEVQQGKVVELSPTQVKAIEILLRKALPDLCSMDATLNGEVVNYVISSEPMTENDWEATYGVAASEGTTESTH